MRKIIIFFLIFSPILDYTYRFRFLSLGGFEFSPNRIFKFIPIMLSLFFLLVKRRNVFLWKYAFFLLSFSFMSTFLGIFSFPSETLDVYIRFLSSFVFIFLSGKLLNEKDLVFILKMLTCLTLIPITISYLQFFQIMPYTDFDYMGGIQIGRVSGGYEKQVAMFSYLIYCFSFALFYFFNTKRTFIKLLSVIYIISVLGVVVLSTHRVSMIVFIIIFSYFTYRYSKKYLIATAIFSCIFIFQHIDLLKLVFIESAGMETEGGALRGRIGFWQDYIYNLVNSGVVSLLIGKGHSVLDTLKTQYLPFLWNEPHSDIIRIIYQYGFIGFLLYTYILSIAVIRSVRFRKLASSIQTKLIGDIGIIIGLSLFLYSITLEPTRYPSFWWYYSAIVSYILVNRRLKK